MNDKNFYLNTDFVSLNGNLYNLLDKYIEYKKVFLQHFSNHTQLIVQNILLNRLNMIESQMGQMMSLVVKSLFTCIPLNKTIEITLEQIYDLKEIK